MTSIDQKAWDCDNYYHLHLPDTVKYNLKDLVICIIKVQCTDQEESK